jgi:hypothetical protein
MRRKMSLSLTEEIFDPTTLHCNEGAGLQFSLPCSWRSKARSPACRQARLESANSALPAAHLPHRQVGRTGRPRKRGRDLRQVGCPKISSRSLKSIFQHAKHEWLHRLNKRSRPKSGVNEQILRSITFKDPNHRQPGQSEND